MCLLVLEWLKTLLKIHHQKQAVVGMEGWMHLVDTRFEEGKHFEECEHWGSQHEGGTQIEGDIQFGAENSCQRLMDNLLRTLSVEDMFFPTHFLEHLHSF